MDTMKKIPVPVFPTMTVVAAKSAIPTVQPVTDLPTVNVTLVLMDSMPNQTPTSLVYLPVHKDIGRIIPITNVLFVTTHVTLVLLPVMTETVTLVLPDTVYSMVLVWNHVMMDIIWILKSVTHVTLTVSLVTADKPVAVLPVQKVLIYPTKVPVSPSVQMDNGKMKKPTNVMIVMKLVELVGLVKNVTVTLVMMDYIYLDLAVSQIAHPVLIQMMTKTPVLYATTTVVNVQEVLTMNVLLVAMVLSYTITNVWNHVQMDTMELITNVLFVLMNVVLAVDIPPVLLVVTTPI
jgi:hypothetical protein